MLYIQRLSCSCCTYGNGCLLTLTTPAPSVIQVPYRRIHAKTRNEQRTDRSCIYCPALFARVVARPTNQQRANFSTTIMITMRRFNLKPPTIIYSLEHASRQHARQTSKTDVNGTEGLYELHQYYCTNTRNSLTAYCCLYTEHTSDKTRVTEIR